MAKLKTVFRCQNCAASYPKWQGQCSECGQWNTLVEEVVEVASKGKTTQKVLSEASLEEKLLRFSQVKLSNAQKNRFFTGIAELDRCLGGGLVAGMVVLLGGEPGIGKSTLLTQMMLRILQRKAGQPSEAFVSKEVPISKGKKEEQGNDNYQIFYIAGEESPSQIMLRINRLLDNEAFFYSSRSGEKNSLSGKEREAILQHIRENIFFVTSTDADEIVQLLRLHRPQLLIVDSIQTLSTQDLMGASGSVGQIRESADRLINEVKRLNVPCFLVGHITKDGDIAGPKILEHMVDAVMILEGERSDQLRMLRSLKNRFGATDEVGIFQTVEYGLAEVSNPSALFLENQDKTIIGAATVCLMEGSRPLLAEVQALVVKSQLAMPRRVGRGIDLARIQVLSAVLQKHAYLPLSFYDIFLSVAGGFKIKESAVDLGLAIAIASSISGKKIPQNIVFVGELGLLGEIRKTPYFERRAKEARRLGFEKIISAETHQNIYQLLKDLGMTRKKPESSEE